MTVIVIVAGHTMDICYCETETIALILAVSIAFNAILMMTVVKLSFAKNEPIMKAEETISPSVEPENMATDVVNGSARGTVPSSVNRKRRGEVWPRIIITETGDCYHREGCRCTMEDGVEKTTIDKFRACTKCLK